MTLFHALAHLLGWQRGGTVSAYDRRGNLWMAFRCARCGRVSDKGLSAIAHPEPADGEFRE